MSIMAAASSGRVMAVAIPVAGIPVVEAVAEEATLEVVAHTVMPMAKQ